MFEETGTAPALLKLLYKVALRGTLQLCYLTKGDYHPCIRPRLYQGFFRMTHLQICTRVTLADCDGRSSHLYLSLRRAPRWLELSADTPGPYSVLPCSNLLHHLR